MARRARQRRGDPGFQLFLLLAAQLASAALVAEIRQPLDPIHFIQAIPSADGVVVQQQHLRNRIAAHPIVQQHQRVRTPGQTMSGRPVPSQLDQVSPRFSSSRKPARIIRSVEIRITPLGKRNLRILGESEYTFQKLGWTDGRNARIEHRWDAGDERINASASELIHSAPDVIVVSSTPAVAEIRRLTSTIPIVFAQVTDPVGSRFVAGLARPGGNITSVEAFEPAMGGKWLGVLREIAPSVSRAAMMYNPETANAGATGGLYQKSIETAASSTGTEFIVSAVHDLAGVDQTFAAMTQRPGCGVLVMPNVFTIVNRERIVAQAARYRVPTIYPQVQFVTAGGLLSYGVDTLDLFRRAASYADRILRGAKPADLPVQLPTKFELAINLKTAKALGLTVPPTLLAIADEVIE